MQMTQLERVLPALIQAGNSIEIVAGPGTGKTALSRRIPAIMKKATGRDYRISEIFCPNVEYTDLAGLGYKKEIEHNGKTLSISDPTVPEWCRLSDGSFIWDHEFGIVVLEEIGQASAEVRKTLANLRLEGRINGWQLPPGWAVIALSNRSSDRSGVTKQYDHEINRRVEIHLDADLDGWVEWAHEAGMHPLLINFAQQNPHIVFSESVPDKQGPWCTPRSLEKLGDTFRFMSGDPETLPMDAVANEIAAGWIGEAASAQLVATIRLANEMPSFKDIIRDPGECRVPDAPDAQMLVAYKLAAMVDEDTFDPVMRYIDRMPKEFALSFLKGACKRNKDLVNTDTFSTWALANTSLFNAVIGK
jgi:hypothetical protein